ncbi:hypothetical protein Pla175_22280 [Pirellulimonas nuda]|uniref:PEP-CTERM protein-sorting domain-containing protein n=1 Tax=Pirellulimonas nuda TaxID=2528009 RepID=A0A518DBI3_9BACT|nr:hypothetical protein [Pirellulimonas nuda]QDU88844.1 hypothetical protein Pla175_22280 [Pirellulimonas nuda]
MRRVTVWVLGVAAVLSMSVGQMAGAATINDWGSGLQSWRFDFGGAGAVVSQDPAVGSPGNAMGALKLEMPFALNTFAFTGDVFGSPTNLTGFSEVRFDVLIAPGSAVDAFGNHGFMNFVSRETNGYNWGNQPGANLAPAVGWTTYSVSTSAGLGMANTRAFTLQLYGGASQNISGPVTLWIDNIRTVDAVPEPASLSACALVLGGLGVCFGRRRK